MDRRYDDPYMRELATEDYREANKHKYKGAAEHWYKAALVMSCKIEDNNMVIAGLTEWAELDLPENYDEAEKLITDAVEKRVSREVRRYKERIKELEKRLEAN